MKKRLITLSVVFILGMSMSFHSCTKDPVADAIITGYIINSQTGLGLANTTLYFTTNLSATDYADAEYTTTTNSDGSFTITVVAGNYIMFVVSDGFFVRIVTGLSAVTDITTTIDAVTLVDAPTAGSYRIVLTWGTTPYDLDSHLTGPDENSSRFHMYYSNKNPNNNVSLDVDDTDSFGPETTTISGFYDGTYRFSVHNYSDRYSASSGSGIVSSPARVELYSSTGLLNTFNPPTFTGNGDTWRVFEMVVNGNNATVNKIGTYTLSTSVDNINDFKNDIKKDVAFKIEDF
jgi:hypothetical protein